MTANGGAAGAGKRPGPARAEKRRASARGPELPQLELDCMVALWRAEEAAPGPGRTAAQLRQALAEMGRPLAYTTVLTVLQRLRQKGVVAAAAKGRPLRFRALVGRHQMRVAAVERLVRNYFADEDELRHFLGGEARRMPPAAQSDFDATLL